MALHQIKSAFTGEVLFFGDFNSLRECVEAAVKARANLDGAYLIGANLAGANLDGANLVGANLVGASLDGADLACANLVGASLDGADLACANLVGADLTGANLVGANLIGAYLVGANLAGANLDGAYLAGAYLIGAELAGATIRRTKLGKRGLLKERNRSDGYRFMLFDCDDGFPRILAGCRWFTLAEARAHWTATRAGTPLGDETMDMLDMFERHIARTGDR